MGYLLLERFSETENILLSFTAKEMIDHLGMAQQKK